MQSPKLIAGILFCYFLFALGYGLTPVFESSIFRTASSMTMVLVGAPCIWVINKKKNDRLSPWRKRVIPSMFMLMMTGLGGSALPIWLLQPIDEIAVRAFIALFATSILLYGVFTPINVKTHTQPA